MSKCVSVLIHSTIRVKEKLKEIVRLRVDKNEKKAPAAMNKAIMVDNFLSLVLIKEMNSMLYRLLHFKQA